MKRYDEMTSTPEAVWFSSIPSTWRATKIRELFSERNTKVSDKDYPALSVGKMGIVPQLDTAVKTDNGDNRKLICKGDFAINSRSDRKGAGGISDFDGSCSLIITVLKPHKELNSRFYHYLLRSHYFSEEYYRNGKGLVSDLWTTKWDTMQNIYIPVPPSSEQDQIVRYLDWQTSRINKLINGYKRQIELLEERKRTVTFYSVVYGLNHNIEMKDSIIPWIDHIPAHWSVKNLAQLFTQVKCKNTNLYEKNLLSLSYGKIKRRNIDATGGLLPESFEGYNIIEKDDIVLRLTDLHNDHKSLRTGIATEKGIVTSAYVTIRNFSENNPQYLHYYLHAFDLNKGFYNVGASGVRQSLNWDNIRTLQILLPPLNEQNQIVDYINRTSTKIDEIKKTYEKKIELFLEYRTRLISDVVTGQIDVRDIDIPEYFSEEEYNDDLQDNNNDMEGDINE